MDAEYGIRSTKEFLGGNAFGIIDALLDGMEYDVVLFRGHNGEGGMSHIPVHTSGYLGSKLIRYQTYPEVGHAEVHIAVHYIQTLGDHIDALELCGWHPFVPCFY